MFLSQYFMIRAILVLSLIISIVGFEKTNQVFFEIWFGFYVFVFIYFFGCIRHYCLKEKGSFKYSIDFK